VGNREEFVGDVTLVQVKGWKVLVKDGYCKGVEVIVVGIVVGVVLVGR